MRISDWSSDVCSSDLRVRHRLGDDHVDELADQRRIAVEIDHAIARRAASHLAATAPRRTLDENALCRADQTLAEFIVELADAVLQYRKPLFFDRAVDGVTSVHRSEGSRVGKR